MKVLTLAIIASAFIAPSNAQTSSKQVFEPVDPNKTIAEILSDKKDPCIIVNTPKGPHVVCPNVISPETLSGLDRILRQ